MKVRRTEQRSALLLTCAFLATYTLLLASVTASWVLSPQVDPLENLCPVMLVLAGALLGRVAIGIALALSLASLCLASVLGDRPLADAVAVGATYCVGPASGWALRRWLSTASRPVDTGERPAVELVGKKWRVASSAPHATASDPVMERKLALLTRRQRDVVLLAIRGLPSREIGELLFISSRTVETHLATAYGRLHVHSRWELIAELTDSNRASTRQGRRRRPSASVDSRG